MNKGKKICNTGLAIDILDRLGNCEPSQLHIDVVEALLATALKIQDMVAHSKLTSVEIHILYLIAIGKNTAEIGRMLSTETKSVSLHKKEIKRKLNATSMAEAVFKGIQLGYITQDK